MLEKLVILCYALIIGRVIGFTSGPPDSACHDANLFPTGHGFPAQNGASPYQILASNTTYKDFATLTVTLLGTASFKGFLIVAVPHENDKGSPLGSFKAADTQDNNLVQVKCTSGLSHTSAFASAGRDKIELEWTPPTAPGSGNVRFIATFVQEREVFWSRESSEPIWDGESAMPTTTQASTGPATDPPALTVPITNDECGTGKSCYSDCEGDICDFLVSWKRIPGSDSKVEIEMFGTLTANQGYIALGLSVNDKMSDVSIIACTADSNLNSVVGTYYAVDTSGVAPEASSPIASSDSEAAFQTGDGSDGSNSMHCRFTYDNSIATQNSDKWKDLNEEMFMFVARGGFGGGVINQHNNIPMISPQAQSLLSTEVVDMGGTKVNFLIKAHACIMVLAWVFCASIGLILARYYKPMWVEDKACGQKVWFSYHRALMLCAMFLTIIGLILILVDKKGAFVLEKDLPFKAHPIIGLIAIICSLINPLIAAFRCHPGDSKRPIFNWVHWFFGTVAHVFAIVAIFLGMLFTDKASLPTWIVYVMMVFCLFHVCVEFILEIHQCCMYDKNRDRQEEFQMTSKGEARAQEPQYAGRGFKCACLGIYVIVVTLLTIAMVAIIAAWGSVEGTK